MPKQQLSISISTATSAGIKSINEDAINSYVPKHDFELASKGIVLALADGVSTAEAGKEASTTAVKQFVDEYYQTPESWSVSQAGQKLLTSINLDLYKKSEQFVSDTKGFLCTFSALVLRSNMAHFFHVGDSRIYHIRDNHISILTSDHVSKQGKNISLARALGMQANLHIDYGQLAMQPGDIFCITSDGIHDFIEHDELLTLLTEHAFDKNGLVKQGAQALIEQALARKSDDNISCQIIQVQQLPAQDSADYNSQLSDLPIPELLAVGDELDGYLVEEVLFRTRRTCVYKVQDQSSGDVWTLKTINKTFAADQNFIDRFVQEEWAASRIKHPNIVSIPSQYKHRNYLYYLMEYLPGITLDKWMEQHPVPSPKQSIKIVKQIAAALKALHQKETLHCDLKPANIIVNEHLEVKIVGFGTVYISGIAGMTNLDQGRDIELKNYVDPQGLQSKNSGVARDVFSLGVITYQLFTRALPYENYIDCEQPQDFQKLTYLPAYEQNARIPSWFDKALQKSVELELIDRYTSVDDFLVDLTEPNPDFVWQEVSGEESGRKLLFWQILCGFWLVMLVIFSYLF